jgi:hypothetical protein
MFCGDENPEEPLTIFNTSPCAAENNPEYGLIGASPVGCTSTGVEDDLLTSFRLAQNYPNPFNPVTTFTYDLPVATPVKLSIYDLTGRLIRTLRNGTVEPAGRHKATWNGRDDQGRAVAAGVYFYRLETEGYTETRRMTLIP